MLSSSSSTSLSRIQRPATICMYCGKTYQRKSSLNKHLVSCAEYLRSQTAPPPTAPEMHDMIKSLSQKVSHLQTRMQEMEKILTTTLSAAAALPQMAGSSTNPRPKKHLMEWLQERRPPSATLATAMQRLQLDETLLLRLQTASLFEVMAYVVCEKVLPSCGDDPQEYPLKSFGISSQVYAFVDQSSSVAQWVVMGEEQLQKLFSQLQSKLLRLAMDYLRGQRELHGNNRAAMEPIHAMTDQLVSKITATQTPGSRWKATLVEALKQVAVTLPEEESLELVA